MSASANLSTSSPAATVKPGQRGLLSSEQLERLESWLDSRFRIPGTNLHYGLDGLIGLIPGIGDLATTSLSALFIADAYKRGARKRTLAKMAGNVAVDMTVGAIPIVGDIFDFAFKSNTKNLVLLKRELVHLESRLEQRSSPS